MHAFLWVAALGYLLIAVFCLLDPKRRLTYAYATAILPFGLAISQLAGTAKDAMSFLDGLALILMGVACGLILSESIRRRIAEKRDESAPANGAGQSL
jgi:predicted lysophospholipase L1 biosynthesis ABC-type transport system permease subunit